MVILNLFRILLNLGAVQSYLHLKMGLPSVLKAGSFTFYALHVAFLERLFF